jgi:hydrogenase nickel incorporation protein HypB
MFRAARWVVFTKLDLLPHVPFKLEHAIDLALAVNPGLDFLMTSAIEQAGLNEWFGFCRSQSRRGVHA